MLVDFDFCFVEDAEKKKSVVICSGDSLDSCAVLPTTRIFGGYRNIYSWQLSTFSSLFVSINRMYWEGVLKFWIEGKEYGSLEKFLQILCSKEALFSQCGLFGVGGMRSDCGVYFLIKSNCRCVYRCDYDAHLKKIEGEDRIKAVSIASRKKGLHDVYFTLTFKKEGVEALDLWIKGIGPLREKRISVEYKDIFHREMHRYMENLDQQVEDRIISEYDRNARVGRAYRSFGKFSKRYKKLREQGIYPTVGHFIEGGYTFLDISIEGLKVHPHPHGVAGFHCPIPQVLFSWIMGQTKCFGICTNLRDLKGKTPEQAATFVSAYIWKREYEGELSKSVALVADAYLYGKQKIRHFGARPFQEEVKKIVDQVEAERKANRRCPYCGKLGCGLTWVGYLEEPVLIYHGEMFYLFWNGHSNGELCRVVDDSGVFEFWDNI